MESRPVVVIGAGPVGLAAAAHAHSRGLPVVVVEAGDRAGASVREWGHVRLFSPWSELVAPPARTLLEECGWTAPRPTSYPTGRDWTDLYLQPLADALDDTAEVEIRYGTTVVGVTKRGRDRIVDSGRDGEPFMLQLRTDRGVERVQARAVIDASGTWTRPNPLGGDGIPAVGEVDAVGRISRHIPDLRDPSTRTRYAGRHVAVAGTGASAQNVLVELAALAKEHPGTRVTWLVRRTSVGGAFGGGDNDQLVARGALGTAAREAAATSAITAVTGFRTSGVGEAADGTLTLTSFAGEQVTGVDEVIAVTGFRPDLDALSEIRLDLDPVLQAPTALAPLIDPNVHSCGTVEPHGAAALAHPEAGFYLVGMKSYGRAPSFLALTGYEQVRSVVAAIDGDHEAATRVELTLPESGVCGGSGRYDDETGDAAAGGCCGPAAATPQLVTLGRRPE